MGGLAPALSSSEDFVSERCQRDRFPHDSLELKMPRANEYIVDSSISEQMLAVIVAQRLKLGLCLFFQGSQCIRSVQGVRTTDEIVAKLLQFRLKLVVIACKQKALLDNFKTLAEEVENHIPVSTFLEEERGSSQEMLSFVKHRMGDQFFTVRCEWHLVLPNIIIKLKSACSIQVCFSLVSLPNLWPEPETNQSQNINELHQEPPIQIK